MMDDQALVLELARELLDRPDLTLDEDFFSAGGDSITAMHLIGRLSRQTGLRLRVAQIFANSTLRDLAASVEQVRSERDRAEQERAEQERAAADQEASHAS
jgi:aryl carrier-like protein